MNSLQTFELWLITQNNWVKYCVDFNVFYQTKLIDILLTNICLPTFYKCLSYLIYPNVNFFTLVSCFQNFTITSCNYKIINTVFPRIVSAETILFWKLDCGNYSREETIQGRKLLISYFLEAETIQGRKLFKGGNYMRKLE